LTSPSRRPPSNALSVAPEVATAVVVATEVVAAGGAVGESEHDRATKAERARSGARRSLERIIGWTQVEV
jgi:hypothetical protein